MKIYLQVLTLSMGAFLFYGKTGDNFLLKGTVQVSSIKIWHGTSVFQFESFFSYSPRDGVLIFRITEMAAGFSILTS